MNEKRSYWLMAATASCSYFLQGYGHTVLNSIIALNDFNRTFPEIATGVNASKSNNIMKGIVVGVLNLGCALGALSCYFVGDWTGRKRMISLASCLIIIGIALQFTSNDLVQLILGRVITGLGVGAHTATMPMWLAECLPADERGRFTLLYGGFANVGMVAASWVNYGFFFVQKDSLDWRAPIAIQILPAIGVLALSWFVPESPRWLVKKERILKAAHSLGSLRGMCHDSKEIHDELREVEKSTKTSLSVGGTSKTFYRAYLAISLSALCTLAGSNVISFFSTTIFENQLHLSPSISRILTAGIQMCQMMSAFGAVFLIDRLGRRVLLMISATVMAICMSIMAGLFSIPIQTQTVSHAIVAFQFICLTGYPIGFHVTPHIYGAEVSPLKYRHNITAIASFIHWMIDFMVAIVTPLAFSSIGYRYYIVYAVINAVNLASLYFIFPETKGRSLDEIDYIFAHGKTPMQVVAIARRMAQEAKDQSLYDYSTTSTTSLCDYAIVRTKS